MKKLVIIEKFKALIFIAITTCLAYILRSMPETSIWRYIFSMVFCIALFIYIAKIATEHIKKTMLKPDID